MKVVIKENSFIAHLAAKWMKTTNMAIVFGNTIFLWNVSKYLFLNNPQWLRHELVHIEQYKKYGFFKFLFLYLKESMKNGYYQNRFEQEARNAELIDIEMDKYEID